VRSTCLSALVILGGLVLGSVVAWAAVVWTTLGCGLPGLVCRPLEGKHFDRPRGCQGGKCLQGLHENLPLQGRVVWFAGGMPEWIIEKRRTWRVHSPCNVQGAAHTQRRDASGFDVPGDQSDGLMADGSHGDAQHRVDLFSQEALGELWC
jgi:hypothetical protein